MAKVVSAWADDDRVYLIERLDGDVRLRTAPARWSFFAQGLDDSDRAAIGRDKRVRVVAKEAGYTRIDCRNRWARKEIAELLAIAARRADRRLLLREVDVSPIRRLLSDVPSIDVDDAPRLGYFDLETDSRRSFEEARTGHARVLSWGIKGDGVTAGDVLREDTDAAEVALLRGFFKAADKFDCLLAWNGDGFDFPVIQERARFLGIEIRLNRWTWLDHLEVFKKYNMHSDGGGEQKSSFKLDHVAGYLLGEGKQAFDASRTWEAWAAGGEERARLVRYNAQDVDLLPRIEDKTGFVALHLAVCGICRVFPDTESLNATAQGDGFLLRLGVERGYRWGNRPDFDAPPHPFKGAYVMEPRRLGAVDNVHVCDFAGLYPSIMRTWNMSPDTKVGGAAKEDLADRSFVFSSESDLVGKVAPVVPAGTVQLPGRTTWFRTDKDGLFRVALDSLVAKRAEYTNEMKRHPAGSPEHERSKRLSGAFKIVANSFYGITGSPYSRFFDVEIAEGVTQTGRWLLESVIGEAKTRGLDPFYGDTDSVFVAGEKSSMDALVAHMNATWAERLAPWGIRDAMPMHVDLDFEKTFRRIIIVSAKRYAGRYLTYKGKPALEDAKPEVKGLEFKRGDTIRLARDMQTEIVMALLGVELPTAATIRAIVDRWRVRVLEAPIAMDDVVLSQSLSKRAEEYQARYTTKGCVTRGCAHEFADVKPDGPDQCPVCEAPRKTTTLPAHVRVALVMRARGEPMGEGARVRYLMATSGAGTEAIPASDPGALERVDRAYYWEQRIYPATERVLEKVYPGEQWGESAAARKQRAQEARGQTRIDFDPVSARADASKPGARVRRRKRGVAHGDLVVAGTKIAGEPRGVVVVLHESSNINDDTNIEAHRRKMTLEALKTAIEAHPGRVPVTLRVTWRDAMNPGRPLTVKVDCPLPQGIAKTKEARLALERITRDPSDVVGFE